MNDAQYESWLKIANNVLKDNPRHYTTSEVDTVIIALGRTAPELTERLKVFRAKLPKRTRN